LELSYTNKIKTYILVSTFFVALFLNKEYILEKKEIMTSVNVESFRHLYQHKINSIKHSYLQNNQVVLSKLYEKVSKKFKVKIVYMKFHDKSVDLKTVGKFRDTMNYLIYLEKINKIIKLNLKYDNDLLFSSINLNLKKSKKLTRNIIYSAQNIKNPFIEDITTNINSKAIIGNFVILDGIWYEKGDKYEKYTISDINKYSIKLVYKDEKKTIRIFDEL
jgi:hypothetical protein